MEVFFYCAVQLLSCTFLSSNTESQHSSLLNLMAVKEIDRAQLAKLLNSGVGRCLILGGGGEFYRWPHIQCIHNYVHMPGCVFLTCVKHNRIFEVKICA